jgi:hypothetical protein
MDKLAIDNILESLLINDNEDKKAYAEFETKVKKEFNLCELFNKFEWQAHWFESAEKVLIEAGYCILNDIIDQIRQFILNKIKLTTIFKFNEFLTECKIPPIDNHYDWLKNNPGKINWDRLSTNSNDSALELLKANPEKIDWKWLSSNSNKQALELLKANPEKIYWNWLSRNSNEQALELLKTNPEKINWYWLSSNSNEQALELLKANQNKIDWNYVNSNEQALELLKANPKKNKFGLVIC